MLQSLCKLVLPDEEHGMVPRISEYTENRMVDIDMPDEHVPPGDEVVAE
jgi:hypothetical protein